MVENGLLFIVSGPSGTGKSTLCKELVKLISSLKFSVSYTTRPSRKGEISGKDYHFISSEAFKTMREKGEFAEWAEIYGHLYGTSRTSIEEAFKNGLDLLFDIDCQGAEQLKKSYPYGITIFVLPPSLSELEKRLRERNTDSSDIIQNRIEKARQEISHAKNYTYIVINDIFAQTLQALHSIVIAEKHRREHMEKYLSIIISNL